MTPGRFIVLSALAVAAACGGDGAEPKTTPLAALDGLAVIDGFAPEPVTPDVASLYFTVHNSGNADNRITGVRVDVAATAEIHDPALGEDGMVRMTRVAELSLPAGETVELAPGGLHVMMSGLTSTYAAGDSLRVSLTFASAGSVEFRVPVIPYADVVGRSQAAHHEGHP